MSSAISRPASVTAEILAPCTGLDRPAASHRIWIHRDGTVTTPSHTPDSDSTAEQVATALGDPTAHTCAYWMNVPLLLKTATIVTVPDTSDWRLETVNLWTTKATWTAMTGLLGQATHTPNNPAITLQHVQTYQTFGGLPADPATHAAYLTTPWVREGGWRRTRATTANELADLLDSGVPIDRAASAAALDLTGEDAAAGIPVLKAFGLPADVLLQLAYALPPKRVIPLLTRMTEDAGARLPARLAELKTLLAQETLNDSDVETFLAQT